MIECKFFCKRIFDIFFSLFFIILLSPLLLPIILLLRATGEGEVFYRQIRLGKNNNPFYIYKFATMLKNSPAMGTRTITMKNDPRVLSFGKLLRKTKLNELPQLLNVLVGDMSVVGPRPLTAETRRYIPKLSSRKIASLKPGITGIGSIIFRNEELYADRANMDYHQFYAKEIGPFKGDLEVWYLKNQGIFLDFKIIIATIFVVFFPQLKAVNFFFPTLPKHPLFNTT
jgi:lipopolysaccharide/colanic/teichoic acid biosynthesis glycosyltransferase